MNAPLDELLTRVVCDPAILAGKPVIRGTRIPVWLLLSLIRTGAPFSEILENYPQLEDADIRAALLFAERTMERNRAAWIDPNELTSDSEQSLNWFGPNGSS